VRACKLLKVVRGGSRRGRRQGLAPSRVIAEQIVESGVPPYHAGCGQGQIRVSTTSYNPYSTYDESNDGKLNVICFLSCYGLLPEHGTYHPYRVLAMFWLEDVSHRLGLLPSICSRVVPASQPSIDPGISINREGRGRHGAAGQDGCRSVHAEGQRRCSGAGRGGTEGSRTTRMVRRLA